MRKIISLLLILICFQNITSFGQLKLLEKIAEDIVDETKLDGKHVEAMPFSIEEAANAVKEALSKGIKRGVQKVNKEDGYFKNPLIKIPFPKEAKQISTVLSKYLEEKKNVTR